jgi:hypothetical protein
VLKGHVIDDLGVLETAIASLGARTVRLQGYEGTSDRAQRAAAHRFRTLDLELTLREGHGAACRVLGAGRPFGIDDEAVDQWWHASMP